MNIKLQWAGVAIVIMLVAAVAAGAYAAGRADATDEVVVEATESVGLTVSGVIAQLQALKNGDLPVVMAIGVGKKAAPIASLQVVKMTSDLRRGWFDKHVNNDGQDISVVLVKEASQ